MDKCACNGSFLDKLIQPALLVILTRGEDLDSILGEIGSCTRADRKEADPHA